MSQETDAGYYPIDLTAIEGYHYRKVSIDVPPFFRYEFDSDLVNPSLIRRIKEYNQHKTKGWRRREGLVEVGGQCKVPMLEPGLCGKKFICSQQGEVTMDQCRTCYLLKPDSERETMNWEACQKQHGEACRKRHEMS